MATKAASAYPSPGAGRTFQAPAGVEWASAFVDAERCQADILVFAGAATGAADAALRSVAAGTSKTFPLPSPCTAVTFLIPGDAPKPAAGDTVYWGASTAAMTATTTQTAVAVTSMPTVTAEISGTANTVQLAQGTQVAISGTVQVTGTVSVGNQPTVTAVISGSGNTVSLASGTTVAISGTVTIAGSVSITNSPTINIGSGNTVTLASGTTVSISGTVTVEFGSAQAVTVDTSGGPVDMNISARAPTLNIAANSLTLLGTAQVSVSDLAAGGTVSFPGITGGAIGVYDGVVILVVSEESLIASYAVENNGATLSSGATVPDVGSQSYGYAFCDGDYGFELPAISYAGSYGAGSILRMFDKGLMSFNGIELNLKNTSSSSISADTVSVWVYAHKAQVDNPQDSPVQSQASDGSFQSLQGSNGGSETGTQVSVSLGNTTGSGTLNPTADGSVLPSGDYITSLVVALSGGDTSSTIWATLTLTLASPDSSYTVTSTASSLVVQLYLGSQIIASSSANVPAESFTPGSSGPYTQTYTTTVQLQPAAEFRFGDGVSFGGLSLGAFLTSAITVATNNSAMPADTQTAQIALTWSSCYALLKAVNPPANVNVVG